VFIAPLMANTSDFCLIRDDFHLAQLQNLILDFLIFCIEHHTYQMRNFLNKKDLLKRILVLLKSKHQFLQLSALRFLRKILSFKDEQYNISIVRNDLFRLIVETFKANKRKYNLLNSALIELFEYIRQEDIKTLISYFIENFYSDFESITYVKTFRDLKLRYDAHRERRERFLNETSSMNSFQTLPIEVNHQSQRRRKDERDVDGDEENWFNTDDDDDDEDDAEENQTNSAMSTNESPTRSHRFLLNNNDDDDDDDDLPIAASKDDATTSVRSHATKPVISIHIRRSPISSVGQLSPTSSSTASNDNDSTTYRVDIPRPITPTDSNSTYAMSPGLSSIADEYTDEDDEGEQRETNVSLKSIQLNENSNSNDSHSSTRKRKINEDNLDDNSTSSIVNDSQTLIANDSLEQSKMFKRSNDQSTD